MKRNTSLNSANSTQRTTFKRWQQRAHSRTIDSPSKLYGSLALFQKTLRNLIAPRWGFFHAQIQLIIHKHIQCVCIEPIILFGVHTYSNFIFYFHKIKITVDCPPHISRACIAEAHRTHFYAVEKWAVALCRSNTHAQSHTAICVLAKSYKIIIIIKIACSETIAHIRSLARENNDNIHI